MSAFDLASKAYDAMNAFTGAPLAALLGGTKKPKKKEKKSVHQHYEQTNVTFTNCQINTVNIGGDDE